MRIDKDILNYIDGELLPPGSGQYMDNIDPSRGEVYARIPDSGSSDVEAAVAAAKKAFPAWASMAPSRRANFLTGIADRIDQYQNIFAEAESRDNGKVLSLSQTVDIPRAQANFRFFASAAVQFASESHHMSGSAINYTLRQPLGVVGCISPWNLPLYLFTWKVAPALASGNTVVAKPSELTPMTAYLLSKVCREVGLPAGVFNIVHGPGPKAGQSIVEHPDVKAISFTGGTQTGQQIASTLAPHFKKVSLELGGKNPNLIFADCDFDRMLDTTMRSSFANNGQICLCGSRIYVQRPIYERFREAFANRTRAIKVGDPFDNSNQMGALVSEGHLHKVERYLKLGQEEGGTILAGGGRPELPSPLKNGYYLQPAILEGLDNQCRTNQEEIFGPVVSIMPFDTEAEALTLANGTGYGLASTLWTSDLNRAHRMAERLEAGIVWVNCWMVRDLRTPFGGVKNSGLGREGGFEAMRFFTEPKNVCVYYGH